MTFTVAETPTTAPSERTSTDLLDLLKTPFSSSGGVERTSEGFACSQPWAVAHFDSARLGPGWWRLECEGDVAGLDVRIVADNQPLLIIPGYGSAGRVFRFSTTKRFDISLLVSPWPGRFAITTLRFVRLKTWELMPIFWNVAKRAFSHGNFISRATRLVLRLLRGEPVGILAVPPAETIHQPSTDRTVLVLAGNFHVEERAGIVAVLFPGDSLHPAAFDIVAGEFARESSFQAILADALEAGALNPRPAWDAKLSKFFDCFFPPLFFRASAYSSRLPPNELLSQLILNEGPASVGRVSLPLVSRASKLDRSIAVVPLPQLTQYPRVSILIPTKTRVDLLSQCLDGLAQFTDYPDLEVVVIDNGHRGDEFKVVLQKASKLLRLTVIQDKSEFNFSDLINVGATHATGDILVVFNDDIEAIDASWLKRIVSSLLEPGVGAVGARLLYPDRSIQHAGIALGLGGTCGHLWKGLSYWQSAQIPQAVLPSERQAVTGACLAVTRASFLRVSGFDAANFPVSFSDVDFCLRLRELGLQVVYRGDAFLLHKESQSRQSAFPRISRRDAQDNRRFRDRWGRILTLPDPYASPAYDLVSESGRVHRALFW